MSSEDTDPLSDMMDEGNAVPPPLFGDDIPVTPPPIPVYSPTNFSVQILKIANSENHHSNLVSLFTSELLSQPIDDVIHTIFLSLSPPTEDVDAETFLASLPKKAGSKCRCDSQWYATEGVENIAFGCKTCALSSASCICVACFEAGDHEGHEFYVSKSDYGCCDCGDIYAWKKSGFCKNHPGPNAVDDPSSRLPEWSRTIAHWFVVTVVEIASGHFSESPDIVCKLLSSIMKLNSYHDGFRRISGRLARSYLTEKSNQCLVDIILPISHTLTPTLRQAWTNCLVDLMLDLEFKAEFSVLFSRHYTHLVLDRVGLVEHGSGRRLMTDIGDFTCQMLTRPDVALRLVEDEQFILTLIKTISEILNKSLIRFDPLTVDSGPAHGSSDAYLQTILDHVAAGNATLEFIDHATDEVEQILTFDEDSSVGETLEGTPNDVGNLFILDHSHQLVKHHETIQSSIDLSYILDHPKVSQLAADQFFPPWLTMISKLQFMNPHKRRTDAHVEFPDSNWSNALISQADLFFSFWLVRDGLRRNPNQEKNLIEIINLTSSVLHEWNSKFLQNAKNVFSLHCPLNRVLGLLLTDLANLSDDLSTISHFFSSSILQLPIAARIFASQAALGMWRRNGESVNMEFEFYRATLFHHHLGTADLHLTQLALISSESVCEEFFNFFANSLEFPPENKNEQINTTLWFLAELLSQQTFIAYSESELACHRLRSVLALQDKSFSALRDPVSERYTHTLMPSYLASLEKSLSDIATKSDTLFMLNDREWFLIDLVSPYWSLRDFEKGEERFFFHLKQKNSSLPEWWKCNRTMQPVIKPQFRQPFVSFLSSPHILAIIFTSLVHIRECPDDYRSLRFIVHVILRLCSSVGPAWAEKTTPCPRSSAQFNSDEINHNSVTLFYREFFSSEKPVCHHPWSVKINQDSILSMLSEIESREKSSEMRNWLHLVIASVSSQCDQTAAPALPTAPVSSSLEKRELMQKKLLDRLAKRQAKFLSSSTPEQPPAESESSVAAVDCVVCLSASPEPSGHLVYLSASALGAFTPRSFVPVSQALIPDESVNQSSFLPYSSESTCRIVTRACGHKLHQSCWEKMQSQSRKIIVNCPYCSRPANALIGDTFAAGFDRATQRLGINESGVNSLDPVVRVMSDLIDQIALSSRCPSQDTDMRSLTDSVGLIRKLFVARVTQLQVPDVSAVFSRSSKLLERAMFGNLSLLEFKELVEKAFHDELAVMTYLIERDIPGIRADKVESVLRLALRPFLFRVHLILHFFVDPEHELPFDEICAVDSALGLDDEFSLLVDQLPCSLAPLTMSTISDITTTSRFLPFLIFHLSSAIEPKFVETYLKRERVKQIDLSDLNIRVVEYFPTVIPILPSVYQKLFTGYLHAKCVACNTTPRLPVVCLLCGKLLCCNSSCCAQSTEDSPSGESSLISIGEVSSHFKSTCALNGGIGVFLQLSNSVVYLVGEDGKTIAPWGSLYLDSHGEEDFGLSKPLQLDIQNRLERLRSELRENSFIWKQSAKNFQWKPVGIL